MKALKTNLIRTIALTLGVVIFYYTLQSMPGGASKVFSYFTTFRLGYFFVVLNSFAWVIAYSRAWQQFFSAKLHQISFLQLMRVKICGEAVNTMTPVGFLAGDPVRVVLLRKYLGPDARLRSVVVDRSMHTLSAYLFNAVGLFFVFFEGIDFPWYFHVPMFLTYAILFVFFFGVVASLLNGNGLGALDKLIYGLKINRRFPKIYDHIVQLRIDLEFYADKPKGPFYYSFALHFFGRILGAVEIAIILYFLEGEILIPFSIILASVTSFVTVAAGVIPGALGVLESVHASFGTLYGFEPETGFMIQVIKRLRVFFWILVGLLLMDFTQLMNVLRKKKPEENQPVKVENPDPDFPS